VRLVAAKENSFHEPFKTIKAVRIFYVHQAESSRLSQCRLPLPCFHFPVIAIPTPK